MYFVVLIIGIPVVILIHETGHAVALVVVTEKSIAKVYLGDFTETNKRSFRIGRIHYHIIWGVTGTCYVDESDLATKYKKAMISLSGPLISLVLTSIFFLFFYFHPFAWFINYFFTGTVFVNIVVAFPPLIFHFIRSNPYLLPLIHHR